jgi:VanZ family protein
MRIKLLTVAFIAILAGIVGLANTGSGARFFMMFRVVPAHDKVGHFVLMGILSFLVNLSLDAARMRVGPLVLLKGSVAVMIIVTLEELSQILIATRSASIWDLFWDAAGIVVFGRLAALVVNRRRPEAVSPLAG